MFFQKEDIFCPVYLLGEVKYKYKLFRGYMKYMFSAPALHIDNALICLLVTKE